MSPLQKLERPKTLRQLKTVYNPKIDSELSKNSTETPKDKTYAEQPQQQQQQQQQQVNGSKNLSILSPFDEQEEWAKISEIMASFGSSLVRESVFVAELEQEFQNRLGLNRKDNDKKLTVAQWLTISGFSEYESAFINFGYDNIDFINGVINDCDLKEIGIINECDRELLLQEASKLPNRVGEFWRLANESATTDNGTAGADLLTRWLNSLDLGCYSSTFQKHLYNSIEKIRKIWEVELTAVLEITKPGHRRRILASVLVAKSHNVTPSKLKSGNNLDDLNADLNQLKSNLQQLKNEIRTKIPTDNTITNGTADSPNTTSISNANNNCPKKSKNNTTNSNNNTVTGGSGTLHRHNHKKSRPAPPPPPMNNRNSLNHELEIRNPSELLIGVPSTLTTQWRHKPNVLLNGTVNYVASYLGSTVVKELRGTESTKKSIQKLKKSTSVVDCRLTPEIVLAISYRGVKFLNVDDQSLICEHEIRNIHCACQDAEDLTHFAYITKDHASKTHYCHVFCVQTMDQATEVILTLGEAFEVAYQMALKEHFSANSNSYNGNNGNRPSGHIRSHSVNNIMDSNSNCGSPPVTAPSSNNHSRSHSINNIIDASPSGSATSRLVAAETFANNNNVGDIADGANLAQARSYSVIEQKAASAMDNTEELVSAATASAINPIPATTVCAAPIAISEV